MLGLQEPSESFRERIGRLVPPGPQEPGELGRLLVFIGHDFDDALNIKSLFHRFLLCQPQSPGSHPIDSKKQAVSPVLPKDQITYGSHGAQSVEWNGDETLEDVGVSQNDATDKLLELILRQAEEDMSDPESDSDIGSDDYQGKASRF
ncbi:MAG: hypothetical protein Q9221_008275 [Calogaya cf. arnoldii]